MSDAHERLRRLLLLVPYVSKHQGLQVDDLAKELGTNRDGLLKELDLLTFVGRPPFQPDDFIDIYVDGDKVYVDLDQRLSAPPRLTAPEAAALSAAAWALNPRQGDALSSALAKLERVLPSDVRARFHEMGQKINASLEVPTEVGLLTQSIAHRREVEFDYFTPNRNTVEHRVVRPRELFNHRGQWYLSAYCTSRKDDRLFRLDRVQKLIGTERTFAQEPAGEPRKWGLGKTGEVMVRFSPQAGPYAAERFAETGHRYPDGSFDVKVPVDSQKWLTQWILSFGGEAEVLEPEWAREAVAQAAEASLGESPPR